MARADPQLVSFAAGEVSPLARGRVDVARYAQACETLENFIVTPQGPIVHRGPTIYLGGTAGNAKALMIPFVASTGVEFVLEVTGTTTRFWYGAGRKLVYNNAGTWNITDTGSIATLATPWAAADLFDTDGSPKLRWVQSNDVMWLVHPSYFPYKITRVATYQFSGAYEGDGINAATPFKDVNPNQTITLSASAETGAITLTAGSAYFTAAMVGDWMYLERPTTDTTPPWETGKSSTSGTTRVKSDGRYYLAASTTTNGTVKPTHSIGTRIDGTSGTQWTWVDDGYGVLAITGYTDSTHVSATVIRRLPNTITGAGNTTRWAHGAWSTSEGFPSAIAFFRERLCYARGQTIWTSVAGDFENFQVQDGGVQTPDMAITATIGSDRNDRIRWLASTRDALIAGTASAEWAISEQSDSAAFGPGNIKASRASSYGVNGVQPAHAGESVLFVERGGKRVREALFDAQIDGFRSVDLNVYADHVWARGTCAMLAAQRVPFGIVWGITSGGQLKGLTYQRDQEVWAWHPHTLGGAGLGTNSKPAVKSIASITSPDGVNDDLWMCVERRINGSTVYYVEVLGPHLSYTLLGYVNVDDLTDVRDSAFMDCAIQKSLLVGATTITGLSHLANESVVATVDGAYVTARTVTSNQITIPTTDVACKSWVGFQRNANIVPVALTGQSETGSAQGKVSRISHLTVRIHQSLNFLVGPADGSLDRTEFRSQSSIMNEAAGLFSGDYTIAWPDGHVDRPRLKLQQDQPFPLIVAGLFPRLVVEEGR